MAYICMSEIGLKPVNHARMKKIVIIDHESLTIRRKDIFYIEALQQAGFSLEFWDCSQYFHPGMKLADTQDESYVFRYDTLEAIRTALDGVDIPNTLFIVEAFRLWKNRRFFRLLSDKGCFTIRMDMYHLVSVGELPLLWKLKNASPRKIAIGLQNRVKGLMNRVYERFYRIKGYDLTLGVDIKQNFDIRLNSPDWEQYRRSYTDRRDSPERYALFLDEYFPLHPDLKHFIGGYRQPDPSVYKDCMLRFFDRYEAETGCPIRIAAHPKSAYDPDYFGGRPIIKYRTPELIRDADAVFVHSSSSIAYAIMFDKPIALIATDDYLGIYDLCIYITIPSQFLKLPIHNIDREQSVSPTPVEKEIRENYIYNYLTCKGIETTSNAEIVIKAFAGL